MARVKQALISECSRKRLSEHPGGAVICAGLGLWILVFLYFYSTASAQDKWLPATRVAREGGHDQDFRFTIIARQALAQDDELKNINIGVNVHDLIATLWGAVPRPAVAERALELLRQVPGLAGVHNELRVEILPRSKSQTVSRSPLIPNSQGDAVKSPKHPLVNPVGRIEEPRNRGTPIQPATPESHKNAPPRVSISFSPSAVPADSGAVLSPPVPVAVPPIQPPPRS